MSTASFGTANHPFRATLPPRVLRRLPVFEPEVQARMDAAATTSAMSAAEPVTEQAPARRRWISRQDVRDFLIAYSACFLAVTAWIS